MHISRSLKLTVVGILLATASFAGVNNITEQDGSPSVYPWKIKVSNGTLTDNGDGSASLDNSGTATSGWTRTAPQVYLTNISDNVGIGTTSPTSQLHVKGTGSTGGSIELDQGLTGNPYIQMDQIGSPRSYWQYNNSGYTEFWTKTGTNFAFSNGNVGIGTTAPTSKLHVAGNVGIGTFASPTIASFPLTITSGGSSAANEVLLSTNNTANTKIASIGAALDGINFATYPNARTASIDFITGASLYYQGSAIAFNTGSLSDNTTNAPVEAMRIINGNVGIGTTAPSQKLHLSGTTPAIQISDTVNPGTAYLGSVTGVTVLSSNVNGVTGVYADTGKAGAQINLSSAAGDGSISFYTTPTNNGPVLHRLTIDNNGNVGVGTNGPTTLLSVAEKFQVNSSGLPVKSNNVALTGYGYPSIFKSDRATAQTAAASLAAYTVGAADGSFIISANVLVTTSTLHNFTVTCTYTDEGNTSRTLTIPFTNLAGTALTAITNAAGAVPYEGIPQHIRCKAGTTITIASTGTFTTVNYNIEEMIAQIS